jgi:hypothetical protein
MKQCCHLHSCDFLFSKIYWTADIILTWVVGKKKSVHSSLQIQFECAVRVTKENRIAGVLENFEEGEKYAEHGLRKFVRNRSPQIMPSINKFFSDPN